VVEIQKADQIVLQQFAPASVLVMTKDIIYITGRTGKYLEPVPVKQMEYPCNGETAWKNYLMLFKEHKSDWAEKY
jgi:hypothetical protein